MDNITVDMLNEIRLNASALYQERVPQATKDNLVAVGDAIYAYDPSYNEFSGLVAKIAMSFSIKRMYENKLKRLKSGELTTASDLEEYFIGAIKGAIYDPTGADALSPKVMKIAKAYHKSTTSHVYKATTSFKRLRTAFTSREGVDNLLNGIVAELSNSSEIDEYMQMKELLGVAIKNAQKVEVLDPAVSAENAKKFVKTTKKLSNDMAEPSSKFHQCFVGAGTEAIDYTQLDPDIITYTPKQNQILFLDKDVEVEIGVEVLAQAFNASNVSFDVSQIIVGDFGTLGETEGVYAILADERLLVVRDTYREILTQLNASGAFVNHFLHIDQMYSFSPFANVVAFIKEPAV